MNIKMEYNKLTSNFLDKEERNNILDYITNNPLYKDYDNKKGFSITYKIDEVPQFLNKFKDKKFNVYNFIGLYTFKNGSIAPHVDCDLLTYIKTKVNPRFIIGYPETIVYYADVCEYMKGGNLIVDNEKFKPVTNSAIKMEKGKVHRVTEVIDYKRPRLVLVCERYNILEKYYNKLNTPIERQG